jgi:hypothetical protein
MCATKAASVDKSCDSFSGLVGEPEEKTVLILRYASRAPWMSQYAFATLVT